MATKRKTVETVRLTAPKGTKVTVSKELAEKLREQGYKAPSRSTARTEEPKTDEK